MGTNYYYLVITANDKNFTPTNEQIEGIFQILRNHDVVPASAVTAIKDSLAGYPREVKKGDEDTYLLNTGYPVKWKFFKSWLGKDCWRFKAALKNPTNGDMKEDPVEIYVGMQVNNIPFRAETGDVEFPFRFQIMDVNLGVMEIWDGDASPEEWGITEPLEIGEDEPEDEDEEQSGEGSSEDMEESDEKLERLVDKFKEIYAALLTDLQEYLGCPVEAWIDEELSILGSRRISPSNFYP